MSPSETPFRVDVASDVETFIVGSCSELVSRGIGSFSGTLAPGYYKFNFRRGTSENERLVEIPRHRTEPVVITPPEELQLETAIPLTKSKRSAAGQVSAARDMSRTTQAHAGSGSSIFIFIRMDADAPPRDPAKGFALHALNDTKIGDIEAHAVRDHAIHPTCAAFNITVAPGAYRLRYDDGTDAREQILIASGGWQTQVFLLHQPAVSLETSEGTSSVTPHPLANASVLMSIGGFDPESEQIELADSARIALSLGRGRMPRDLMSKLLMDKFESPMLGLYAAHAIALSGGKDDLLARVIAVLESTIPNHPDVAALRLGSAHDVVIDTPPMLRSSWNLIMEANLDGKVSFPDNSPASRLPTSFAGDTPWLIWSVDELLPVEAASPRDVTADLEEIKSRIEITAYQETPSAPVELTGWEEAIYSYLQRRASYQREESSSDDAGLESITRSPAARPSASSRLDERAIARAFGTTVNHVQSTVANLAAKLKTP
jgi:hypothetical protein